MVQKRCEMQKIIKTIQNLSNANYQTKQITSALNVIWLCVSLRETKRKQNSVLAKFKIRQNRIFSVFRPMRKTKGDFSMPLHHLHFLSTQSKYRRSKKPLPLKQQMKWYFYLSYPFVWITFRNLSNKVLVFGFESKADTIAMLSKNFSWNDYFHWILNDKISLKLLQ